MRFSRARPPPDPLSLPHRRPAAPRWRSRTLPSARNRVTRRLLRRRRPAVMARDASSVFTTGPGPSLCRTPARSASTLLCRRPVTRIQTARKGDTIRAGNLRDRPGAHSRLLRSTASHPSPWGGFRLRFLLPKQASPAGHRSLHAPVRTRRRKTNLRTHDMTLYNKAVIVSQRVELYCCCFRDVSLCIKYCLASQRLVVPPETPVVRLQLSTFFHDRIVYAPVFPRRFMGRSRRYSHAHTRRADRTNNRLQRLAVASRVAAIGPATKNILKTH